MGTSSRKKKRPQQTTADLELPDEPKHGIVRGVYHDLHPETRASILALVLVVSSIILLLSKLEHAGPAGHLIARAITALLGWGYPILPLGLLFAAGLLLFAERRNVVRTVLISTALIIFSALGLIDIFSPNNGGWLGIAFGALKYPFDTVAATIINTVVLIIAVLMATNASLRYTKLFTRATDVDAAEAASDTDDTYDALSDDEAATPEPGAVAEEVIAEEPAEEAAPSHTDAESPEAAKPHKPIALTAAMKAALANYVAPTLDLLKSSSEKPTTGDLRANANIIKRTLESFGIAVEMGEINIGPKVTRYTLKPAEGVKLSRITALGPDLSLALAAHPIRMEAPIPGKSLVGIEVPNKMAAMVRLGSLLTYPEFKAGPPLSIVMGRDVTGEPIFSNIAKMPHLLVAGATGSGKSIFMHTILTQLLFKNSPATLKLVLVDPKRVELTMYQNLPHLALPVVTENKKALAVLKWAIQEMEQRYELFSQSGSRDLQSYNSKHKDELLPYIIIVIDEMADLMATFGREVEGYIIRLAQMARATGIHLILATQRPSVEVITGLIKANITNRVGLQVASQIDSRTILDMSGAEKLLGGGDLLFLSPEHSQPKRIQGAYISEEEIVAVTDFIKAHNDIVPPPVAVGEDERATPNTLDQLDTLLDADDNDDELYDEAVSVIASAQKASASLLQRRLKVGYARAARLLDLMEQNDLIGPGEGAKPREVFMDKIENHLER